MMFFSCRLQGDTQEEQVGDSFSSTAILNSKCAEGAPGLLQYSPWPQYPGVCVLGFLPL